MFTIFSNSLCIQWGTYQLHTALTITYPIKFKTHYCTYVSFYGSSSSNGVVFQCYPQSINQSGFSTHSLGGTYPTMYIAVGKI